MLSRPLKLLLFPALVLSSVGCPKGSDHVEESGSPPRPMELGEIRQFQFAADGYWHQSDVQVMYEDLLLIELQGLSQGLAVGAVECRAGGRAIYVEGRESFRFKHFAPLEFRAVTTQIGDFAGPVEVKITKRDSRR